MKIYDENGLQTGKTIKAEKKAYKAFQKLYKSLIKSGYDRVQVVYLLHSGLSQLQSELASEDFYRRLGVEKPELQVQSSILHDEGPEPEEEF
jgi:hypothetical protein